MSTSGADPSSAPFPSPVAASEWVAPSEGGVAPSEEAAETDGGDGRADGFARGNWLMSARRVRMWFCARLIGARGGGGYAEEERVVSAVHHGARYSGGRGRGGGCGAAAQRREKKRIGREGSAEHARRRVRNARLGEEEEEEAGAGADAPSSSSPAASRGGTTRPRAHAGRQVHGGLVVARPIAQKKQKRQREQPAQRAQ